ARARAGARRGGAGLWRALPAARAGLGEAAPLADARGGGRGVSPPLFRDLVRAGEASGALGTVLARLADHTEAAAAMRARLRAALVYPAVVSTASVAILGFLLAWVVPQVSALFADTGMALPLATGVLVGMGHVVQRTWWLALGVGAVGAWAGRRWAATPAGRRRIDAMLLRLPVAGRLVTVAAVSRVARTLAILLAGGVPV